VFGLCVRYSDFWHEEGFLGRRTMAIKADPYDYPFDGDLQPANTALMVIDMQFDFLR
jgi:hypothetical protein